MVVLALLLAVTIRGTVVDATGLPLVGAIVAVKDSGGTIAVTDAAGAFAIAVPDVPRVTLVASLPGFDSAEVALSPADSPTPSIVLQVARVREEVRVRGDLPPPPPAKPDSPFALAPLDVVRTAGAQADLMRALATLPGVQRIDEGTGLFVRGGDVSEVLVMLGGVPMNHPYRYETPTGGFRGAVDPFMTSGISFTTGGFSAKYGNALSGVLDLESLGKPRERQVSATAGLAGLSAAIAQPIGSWGGLRVSANRATPRLLFAVNRSSQTFDRYPDGWDVGIGADADLGRRRHLRVFTLTQRDGVGVELEKDAFVGFLHSDTRHDLQVGQWDERLPRGWLLAAAAGHDRYSKVSDVGILAVDEVDRRVSGRLDLEGPAGGWRIRTGVDGDTHRTDAIGTVPQSGGDFGGIEGLSDFRVDHRDWRAGSYIEASRTVGVFTPTVGVRGDRFDGAAATRVDPRASVRVRLGADHHLRIAWGEYHQAPSPAYVFLVRGATVLAPMGATHYIAGYELGNAADASFFRIEAYRKRYRSLPLEDNRALSSDGYGSADGVDAFAHRIWPRLELRASGSWLRARRRWTPFDQQDRYPIPAGTWQPDFAIPWSGQIVANVNIARPLAIGASWRSAAGRPYTPVVGAEQTPVGYSPVWGTINSARLPRYERLDLSASVLRPFESGGLLVFFASLDNALNRRNFFEYAYSADYTSRRPVVTASSRSVYVGITITK
jgi:vitamin B12 transporter